MIRIVLLTGICVVAAVSPSLAGDGYYYAVDDSFFVDISNDFIAVQLDTFMIGGDIGTLFSGKPCVSSEPTPEYLGREFYVVPLEPECSYGLAAGNLMVDPEVTRIAPVYLTPEGAMFKIADLISVQFEHQLGWDSVLSLLTGFHL